VTTETSVTPLMPAAVRPEWRYAAQHRPVTGEWGRLPVDMSTGSTVLCRRLPSGRVAFAVRPRES
jgi:hypothetical protein